MKCRGFPGDVSSKETACQRRRRRHRFDLWDPEDPRRRKWQSTFSILAWEIPWTEALMAHGPQSRRVRHNETT